MKAKKPTVLKTPLWMPVYISEHVADTGRQSAAEHGAYMRLLYSYWRSGPPPTMMPRLPVLPGCRRPSGDLRAPK